MASPVKWRLACEQARRETDPHKIGELISAAILSLHERLDELGIRQGPFMGERLAIFEAFQQLDALRRDYKRYSALVCKSVSSATGPDLKGLLLQ